MNIVLELLADGAVLGAPVGVPVDEAALHSASCSPSFPLAIISLAHIEGIQDVSRHSSSAVRALVACNSSESQGPLKLL